MSGARSHWLLSVRPAPLASFLKRVLGIKRQVVRTSEGRFFVDPASTIGDAIITQPAYEPHMLQTLKALLSDGDTFLDVGTNEGYFSIIASRLVGESGTVLSIEPQSRLQGVIYRNVAENGAFNVHVFQLAISDARGTAEISLLPDMNTGGSGLYRITKYAVPTELVPQTTLRDFLSLLRVDKIRLMKIDIEGFEYEAILGSKELFAGTMIENIALELHPAILAKRNKLAEDILRFLQENGYQRNPDYPTLIMTKRPE